MGVTNDVRKRSVPRFQRQIRRPRRVDSCVRLAACIALPLLLLAACGGSDSASEVQGNGALSPGSSGALDIMVPTTGQSGSTGGLGGAGSSTPGPYMLPVGFTKAQMGGYELGAPSTGTTSAGASSGGDGSSSCGTQILGVVRDFKGINEPNGHPDFEHFSGSGPSKGIVKADLGSDQKPVYAADGAFTDPTNGQQTTSKADFDQWYRNTQDVNKPYAVYLYFEPHDTVLTFQSTSFFPLDDAGWGNSCNEPDATCKKQQHNFGFTTEVHTRFLYKGGETFAFTGDDDLWVFINHKLAIDLGGLHPQSNDMVSLDAIAKDFGLSLGSSYDLDLFHAERHTSESNFRVDTTLDFTNCGTILPDVPVK